MQLEKTTPYFSKSTYIQLIGAVAIFCLFHDVWFHFFTSKIVEPYLSIIKKHWLKDVAFATLSLGIFILLLRELIAITTSSPEKHLGINKGFNLSLLFVAIYYSIGRFQGFWCYESFACCFKIAYSDIFLLLGLLAFAFLRVDYHFFKNKIENTKTDFFLDKPIEELEEDKLQYKNYAENLASKINGCVFSNPFAIGVTSEWGTGKTSFINLVKKNLKPEILQIDFSPWHYNSTEKMLSEFFSLFEQKINENNHFNNELSRLITNYRQQLVADKESFFSKVINTINIFKQEDSLNSLYKKINDKLISLNLNIVVFIDDLDRLNPDEVYEVLRLVRNSGSFKRTCFVVAYDREYVVNALKQLNINSPSTYLEKLFQIEASLPYFAQTPLENELKSLLLKILSAAKKGNLITDELFEKNNLLVEGNEIFIKIEHNKRRIPVIFSWITNMRDVNRLANSISLNTKNLFKEVLFKEFIHIELLRLKFPAVYGLLRNERERFFDSENNLLFLRTNDKKEIILELHLNDNKDPLFLNSTAISNIIVLLNVLFGLEVGGGSALFKYSEEDNKISIKNSSTFYAYFSYGIIPEILSNERFLNLLDKPFKDAKIEVDEIISSVLKYQFLDRLKSVSVDEIELNFTKYKNLLEIFMYTESKPMVGMGFDYFYQYVNPKGFFIEKLKIENPKEFLIPLFKNIDYGVFYKAGFINYLAKTSIHYGEGFNPIFQIEEVEELLLVYLKHLTQEKPINHKLVDEVWVLCNLPGIVRQLHPNELIHKDVTIPEAREVFKNYISQDGLDEFIDLVIQKNGYLNYTFVLQVFQPSNTTFETLGKDTLQNFYSFLDTLDEQKWPRLNEYKQLKFENLSLD